MEVYRAGGEGRRPTRLLSNAITVTILDTSRYRREERTRAWTDVQRGQVAVRAALEEPQGFPADDVSRELYARLADGDPVATSEIASAFIDPLARWLRRTGLTTDDALCDTAAGDALLSLFRNPASYRSDRLALGAYLRMSAKGDLRNALEAEARRRSHYARMEAAEHVLAGAGDDPGAVLEKREAEREALQRVPPDVISTLASPEHAAFVLMCDGERSTVAFARVLGISHLSDLEQRREVKRVKDRIKKRIERGSV
jgi:DNA-directed RNA polymerase specialized sigma24 family protein